MEKSERFADVVRAAIGDRTQRDVSDATGISQAHIHNMQRGNVPSPEKVRQFADGLSLPGQLRSRLFWEAGYVDHDAAPSETERALEVLEAGLREIPGVEGLDHSSGTVRTVEDAERILRAIRLILANQTASQK